MMNTERYAQKLLLCCRFAFTCQPAQNEAASWSALVPGHSQAENTYETTQGNQGHICT